MKTIGNVIALVFGKDVLNKALGQSKLQADWDKILEETFTEKTRKRYNDYGGLDDFSRDDLITAQKAACHSRIAYIKNSIIFVEIDHQGWMQIIQTVQKKIINVINRKYPDISLNSIAFLLTNDSEGSFQKNKEAENPPEPDNPELYNGNENRYEKIKDERLKQVLMQLEKRVNTIDRK